MSKLATIIFLALLLHPKPVSATCYEHKVIKGDTLVSLSKLYYTSDKYWQDIKWHNNLKSNKLPVDTILHIYVPSQDDWHLACTQVVNSYLSSMRRNDRSEAISGSIIEAITVYEQTIDKILSAEDKLEICRYALTTAHQESFFNFEVGAAGEIGIYQFKLGTVRQTYNWYHLKHNQDARAIVVFLLDDTNAAYMFILHFMHIRTWYKSLYSTWKRYNNGPDAEVYANSALEKYWRVRSVKPLNCEVANEEVCSATCSDQFFSDFMRYATEQSP